MNMINESDVNEFIRRLPDISANPPTCHLVMLSVRSRKARAFQQINPKDMLVERAIVKPMKDWRNRMLELVYNFSTLQRYGHYSFWDVNNVKNVYITGYAMCVLSTVSPRNATASLKQTMVNAIEVIDTEDPIRKSQLANYDSKYFSALHASPVGHKSGGGPFVTIDVDSDEEAVFDIARDIVSPLKKWMITEVSRGKHIVLDLRKEEDAVAFFHKEHGIEMKLKSKVDPKEVEVIRDNSEPIAGTLYPREMNEERYVKIIE